VQLGRWRRSGGGVFGGVGMILDVRLCSWARRVAWASHFWRAVIAASSGIHGLRASCALSNPATMAFILLERDWRFSSRRHHGFRHGVLWAFLATQAGGVAQTFSRWLPSAGSRTALCAALLADVFLDWRTARLLLLWVLGYALWPRPSPRAERVQHS
jgi:hypothetical protein